MDWIVGLLVAIAAFSVGAWGAKGERADLRNKLIEVERRRLEAEARYLEALQRELALLLLRHDRPALLDAHASAQAFVTDMRAGKPEKIERAFKALINRYPRYEDFDLFQLRAFVPPDMRQVDLAEVAARYADIGRFLAVIPGRRSRLTGLPEEHWTSDRRVLERVVEEEEKASGYRREMEDHWTGRSG